MFKTTKQRLYFLKVWYENIFLYPKDRINVNVSQNYDVYWEEKRGDDIGVLSDWQKIRADIIVNALDKNKPISIGDIGCGEGSIIKYLENHANIRASVGYDSSDFVLEKAKAIGLKVIKMNFNNEKELSKIEPADYMLILEVLEHIPESERLLEAAYKKANRGVFISFPNSGYFIYRLRLLFGKFPKQWVTFPNEHLRFWTAADLKWWLKALDYTDYEIFYYKGIPILNRIWPSLFAAAFVVEIRK